MDSERTSGKEGISGHEKCIRQPALNAGKNVRYHSSQLKESLSFAKNAIEKRKDSNSLTNGTNFFLFFSYFKNNEIYINNIS